MISTSLYRHQFDNVLRFHMLYPKTADWSDCGIGKSLIALAKFSALYDAGAVGRLLITCPLSVMSSWRDEIHDHTDFRVTTITGTKDKKLEKIRDDSHVYLVTYDTVAGRGDYLIYKSLLEKFCGDNMIVCDEASMLQYVSTARTKALTSLCDSIKFSMFLSGTFIPQNLQNIFTIYRAMDGGRTFGKNIFVARSYFMENKGYAKIQNWELREERRAEFLNSLYKFAIRLKKEDCIDLPEKVYEKRYCTLTSEQAKLYNDMRINLSIDLKDVKINAVGVLAKLLKMQQIVGGFIYDKQGKPHNIKSNKYDILTEVLNQTEADEKVVIYARFKEELHLIVNTLDKCGYKSVMLHGGLNEEERARNINTFRKDKEVKALVSQVATGGYGLTVVEANHIIYLSMTFSLISFLQSQDRIHRIGQTRTCIYHFLLTEDGMKRIIDEYIYNSVMNHVDISSKLSDPNILKSMGEELCN